MKETTAMIRYTGGLEKREKRKLVIDNALEAMLKGKKNLTAKQIVEKARDPKHPLHPFFEWDDGIAAEKFRIAQAYAMILASRFTAQIVTPDNSHMKVLKSVSVRRLVNSFKGEGFKLRTDALKNNEDRAAIVEKKKAVLKAWCESVIDIEELSDLRATIEGQLH